jgi:toxin ParE1/3/4
VEVIFTPLAERHLDRLHQYITTHASEDRADHYVGRIVAFCKVLTTFPMRETPRDDLLPGLRVTGFERRVTIAFVVTEAAVLIQVQQEMSYAGRAKIDTDKLHERIHEELERDGGTLLKTIAHTTALFAAIGAVAALLAGGTVNEALVLKTEATRLQAEASDQWAAIRPKKSSLLFSRPHNYSGRVPVKAHRRGSVRSSSVMRRSRPRLSGLRETRSMNGIASPPKLTSCCTSTIGSPTAWLYSR